MQTSSFFLPGLRHALDGDISRHLDLARLAEQFLLRLVAPGIRALDRKVLGRHVAADPSELARSMLLAGLHAGKSVRARWTAGAGPRAFSDHFRPERLDGRHVRGDDGDFDLESGDDDHSPEDVGEVGVDVELVEDDQAEHGDQDCDSSEPDDSYHSDFASGCHVKFPDRMDGKYEDEDVGGNVLELGQSVEVFVHHTPMPTYQECWDEEHDQVADALCLGVGGWVEEGIQGDALEAGDQPVGNCEHDIEAHGHIHPAAERGFPRETKVEE